MFDIRIGIEEIAKATNSAKDTLYKKTSKNTEWPFYWHGYRMIKVFGTGWVGVQKSKDGKLHISGNFKW